MSAFLERIRAQLKPDELRSVEIPEWGDDAGPFVGYFRPPTIADIEAASMIAKGKNARMNVELVVMKLCDAEGKALFERMDAAALMSLPGAPTGISRVVNAMGLLQNLDAAEKNSEAIPS